MQQGFRAEKALGYGQLLAAAVDAGVLLSTISLNGVIGIPDGTILIVVQPEAQAVRYRDDGTAPTAAIGQPLAVGQVLQYTAQNAKQLRFTSQVAGAVLNCTFYGQDI
jgi:hypothetical protein